MIGQGICHGYLPVIESLATLNRELDLFVLFLFLWLWLIGLECASVRDLFVGLLNLVVAIAPPHQLELRSLLFLDRLGPIREDVIPVLLSLLSDC